MIAPVVFEDLNFPEQRTLQWSNNDSLSWMRAGAQYFTTTNGVSYGTPVNIGSSFGAVTSKYAGGALALNGNIYTLGHLPDNYLVIDTLTDAVSTTGSISPTDPSSNASAYSPFTNCIYSDADDGIYKFNVATSAFSFVSKGFTGQAILLGPAQNGTRIYFHGFFNQRRMYYYDILTDTVTNTGVTWTGDRLTGCLSWNNKFYIGGGGSSTNFLVYDVNANSATTITGGAAIAADQYRNFIQYYDGFLYTFGGFGANRIKRINPVTNEVVDVFTMAATNYNFNDFAIGADGKIYCVGASNVLGIYDPRTNSFTTGTMPGNHYEGIVMGAQGDLYAIPWNSTTTNVAKIPILNNGRVIRVLQEYNGMICRHLPS